MVVYDEETYPNIFSAVIADCIDRKWYVFEISDRKNDSKRLMKYMKKLWKNKTEMVGFNNEGFDYPILHKFMHNPDMTSDELYEFAMSLIQASDEDKFANKIREKDVLIPQIDLYKIMHYDNKAKATGLKMLEFNMRSKNIEDLPYPVGKELTFDEMDVLLKYNRHDVKMTYDFLQHIMPAIELRRTLIVEYGINCMNFNDTKIGKEYFVKELEAVNKGCCYEQGKYGRKIRQTKRDKIDLSDIIFDYIDFERDEFQQVRNWIERQVITETKGVFSDIEEHDLGDVAKYAKMKEKKLKLKQYGACEDKIRIKELRAMLKVESDEDSITNILNELYGVPSKSEIDKMMKLHPLGWIDRVILKSGKVSFNFMWRISETLNVIINGLEYVFGLGGLHASVDSETFVSDDKYVILDYDFSSYYPNLFISNNIYPEHLGETFCKIYKDVYEKRKTYPKGTPQNAVMKLALNGTYGATNDKFSPFYDPRSTMSITINGQMTLCNLIEKLLKLKDLTMIQANSDGITFKCKRSDIDLVSEIVKGWDNVTGLEMEREMYSLMAINNVNNYIAVYENGKYKRNGQYEYKIAHIHGEGLQFHQNQSMLIAKEAAFERIVNGIPVEETIRNHKDPFDFCLRAKVPRSNKLITVDHLEVETKQQNVCRYYISTNGDNLIKVMPPLEGKDEERPQSINAGWGVSICNDMDDFKWDIDYDYYIQEANKLVHGVGYDIEGD